MPCLQGVRRDPRVDILLVHDLSRQAACNQLVGHVVLPDLLATHHVDEYPVGIKRD